LAISPRGSCPNLRIEPAEPIMDTGSSGWVDLSSQKLFGSCLWIDKKTSAGFTKPLSFASSRRKMATLCEIGFGGYKSSYSID